MNAINNFQSESLRIKTTVKRLIPRLEARFSDRIIIDQAGWQEFLDRFNRHFASLFKLYYNLYGDQYDFFYHLEELTCSLTRMWFQRPADLRTLDRERESNPLWYQSNNMLGGVCYVDLFAGNLEGIREKIPYFKELGLTYLHLMPLFKVPDGENDGGYAISSYREVNENLGTTNQLRQLAKDLRQVGISLVLDLVFNHTSNEHEWALKAQAGDLNYQNYYWLFPDRKLPDSYEMHLREIFPSEHSGAFTYNETLGMWVWTTFHSYQWDLKYANPEVFTRMVEEMLFLANVGAEVIRLDAVAFIWKELGTNCENLPQAHTLIRAFNAVARISAPSLVFKSEAIVHPDEVNRYISPGECQVSYNPLLMALLWNSLATRKTRLLNQAIKNRFKIHPECAWVNYVRVHDDIGWTFSDEDASQLWINGYDHRQFLNTFFSGRFDGSFARGLLFQENPATGDARISGTCASLAGLEKAILEETPVEVDLAIRRILLIHGVILTIGGIPLIYLGDEIGTLNDYSFLENPKKADDSRWVHRPVTNWNKMVNRKDPESIEGRIYQGIMRLIDLRKSNPAFNGQQTQIVDLENTHLLGYIRSWNDHRALVIVNFSEQSQSLQKETLLENSLDTLSLRLIQRSLDPITTIIPYQFLCLEG